MSAAKTDIGPFVRVALAVALAQGTAAVLFLFPGPGLKLLSENTVLAWEPIFLALAGLMMALAYLGLSCRRRKLVVEVLDLREKIRAMDVWLTKTIQPLVARAHWPGHDPYLPQHAQEDIERLVREARQGRGNRGLLLALQTAIIVMTSEVARLWQARKTNPNAADALRRKEIADKLLDMLYCAWAAGQEMEIGYNPLFWNPETEQPFAFWYHASAEPLRGPFRDMLRLRGLESDPARLAGPRFAQWVLSESAADGSAMPDPTEATDD